MSKSDDQMIFATIPFDRNYNDYRFANSFAKLTVKTALIGSACMFAPTLLVSAYGIKTLILGSLFLYSGAIDNLINCIV